MLVLVLKYNRLPFYDQKYFTLAELKATETVRKLVAVLDPI